MLGGERGDGSAVSTPDLILVRIFEVQAKGALGGWGPDLERPWTLASGEPCSSPEEYQLPKEGEVYCWSGNWKLDKPASLGGDGATAIATSGCDKEGWTYASRYTRFSIPDRSLKPEAKWNDGVRRRLWVRTMRKEFSKGSGISSQLQIADMSRIIPRMQHGLEKINEARKKIETIMKQAPEAAKSEQMLNNILSVRRTIVDITSILDQLERAQGPGSAHMASIKKLKREVAKEEAAMERALSGSALAGSPSPNHNKFSHLSRSGSGSEVYSSAAPHSPSSSSSKSTKNGIASGIASGVGAGSVKGGNQGAFNPSLLATPGHSTGELNLDDGCFVDQNMHDRLVAQKLHPVDEASVMQEIIDERNEEINKLHKGIVEINEMFVDLSRIVGEQGILIESIWSNVDEGNATTKVAFKNIVSANRLQRGGNCAVM